MKVLIATLELLGILWGTCTISYMAYTAAHVNYIRDLGKWDLPWRVIWWRMMAMRSIETGKRR